ncbi:hypothetical protein LMG22037_04101 [Paraburkholderia phenoliruptrix]|uniref:Uncharacterized protein n=1 Tax=Paraburkholderia phenoliruptrix TaxID=252970 RepID=A0A6J5BM10_9BURK|nr:hypothetical protein LMG22037_04101 [Paraburkholderia phenoliruptrix]
MKCPLPSSWIETVTSVPTNLSSSTFAAMLCENASASGVFSSIVYSNSSPIVSRPVSLTGVRIGWPPYIGSAAPETESVRGASNKAIPASPLNRSDH